MEKKGTISYIDAKRADDKEPLYSLKIGDSISVKSEEKLSKDGYFLENEEKQQTVSEDLLKLCGKVYEIDEKIHTAIANASRLSDIILTIKDFNVTYSMLEHFDKKKDENKFSFPKVEKDEKIIEKMISLVDIDSLISAFSIGASNCYIKVKANKDIVKDYLRDWAYAKYDFFLMMGEKLSVTKLVDIKLDTRELDILKDELCQKEIGYAPILSLFSAEELLDNICQEHECFSVYFPDKFKKGMKVSKFISKLFEDEKFDIELSKLLQNRYIKGNVTLSIDPMDYMTVSLNKNDWSSCHKITDGAHFSAPFSLMTDDCNLVAFKHNNSIYDYEFYGHKFKCNSKQVRCLVNVDKNSCAVLYNKVYPNNDKVLDSNFREVTENLISDYVGIKNDWTYEEKNYRDFVQEKGFVYKDPVNSTSVPNGGEKSIVNFYTGSTELKCLCCGKSITNTRDGRLVCNKC